MSRAPTSPSRTRKQRERTVGRSRPPASAHRMIVTPAGGSSSVLSRADWASSFIRSAPSTIATRAPPSTGISGRSPIRSRTPRNLRVGPTDDDLPARTGRPEPMEVGVAAALDEPARPAGAAGPVGRGAPCTAARPRGRAPASSCRPRPGRPGGRPAARSRGPSRPPRRARPACPRVRAPSIGERSGGVGRRPPCGSSAASVRAAAAASPSVRGRVSGGGRLGRRRLARAPAAWPSLRRGVRPARLPVDRRPRRPVPSDPSPLGRRGATACEWRAAWPPPSGRRRRRLAAWHGSSRAGAAASAASTGARRPRPTRWPSTASAVSSIAGAEPAGPEPASGRPGPGASPRARAGRRSTARSSCAAPTVPALHGPITAAAVAPVLARRRARPRSGR